MLSHITQHILILSHITLYYTVKSVIVVVKSCFQLSITYIDEVTFGNMSKEAFVL